MRFSRGVALLTGLIAVGAAGARRAGAEQMWTDVARAPADQAAWERRQAQAQQSGGGGQPGRRPTDAAVRQEVHLRRAARLAPIDFETRRQLAELLAATGRPGDAAREFASALRVAPTPGDAARAWFRVATERSRLGAYADALDAYARQRELAPADTAALGNAAELSMALGRLDDAIDLYREAVAIDERDGDRRDRIQALALGYFGLAVALDRADRPIAAGEALGRAMAFDPGLAVLRLAEQGAGDLFFVPAGDVFYYLGMAREAQGRADDAGAAFANFLRVATGSPYAGRARAHLAWLARRPDDAGAQRPAAPLAERAGPRQTGTPNPRLRVVHHATLQSDGPLVAPLIDAAWRLDQHLLDDCLNGVEVTTDAPDSPSLDSPPTAFEVRLRLDVRLDETGTPTAVTVERRRGLASAFAACIETAVLTRLRVSRPARKKPTRARIEVVLAPAEPSGL